MPTKVIGNTNQLFVTVARISTKDDSIKPFAVDEYLVIEDILNENPICKVQTTTSLSNVAQYMNDLRNAFGDISLDSSNVYIATASIEKDIKYPIKANASLHTPNFNEISPILYSCNVKSGIPLGVIQGTEKLYEVMPEEYKDIAPIYNSSTGKDLKQDRMPLIFNYRKMVEYPHIGLFGGSGSGKTYGMKVILEELIQRKVPGIVLDPHFEMGFDDKTTVQNIKNNVEILHIGKDVGIDFTEISTAALIDIMKFSGEMSQPMVSAMYVVHNSGDTFLKTQNTLKTLIDVFQKKEDKAKISPREEMIYNEFHSQVSGLSTLVALAWRLNRLEKDGVFNSNIVKVHDSLMQKKTCVIRGSLQMLNIVGSHIVNTFFEKRRAYIDGQALGLEHEAFVPFVISMDEAHSFAPSGENYSPMTNILKIISQEGRKYGIFEILATQRPKLLNTTIIAQLSTKFIFRTSESEDIKAIQRETDLNEESIQRLPNLEAGSCFVSSPLVGRGIAIHFKSNKTKSKISKSVFDELEEIKDNDEIDNALLAYLPITPKDYIKTIQNVSKDFGIKLSVDELVERLNNLSENCKIRKEKSCVGISFYSN